MKISIEGNIASGKSTIISCLQESTRLPVFLEPIGQWSFLQYFYQDTSRWGFAFNLEVLYNMHKFKHNNYPAIYERTPNTCRYVFTQLQYEENTMTKEELVLFDKIYKEFSWDQDVLIYLKTDPSECYNRMKNRNRKCEDTVPLDYLQKVDDKHNDMIKYLSEYKKEMKIFIIDANRKTDLVFDDVMEIVSKVVKDQY
jgi:deoxyadenosine/deoxycytidine kinase